MNHDVIGDIHGHADKLTALLKKMGYRNQAGAWRHPDPDRTAIFVGDLIDRGPGQLETIGIVRAMLDAGTAQAVMGNHEFNAVAWHTPDPHRPREHLRPRNAKNHGQHRAFLSETQDDPKLHQELVDWFLSLPLWLDLPGLRVIHACWDAIHIAELEPKLLPGRKLDVALVESASRHASMEFAAIEALLKGPEIALPNGQTYVDGNGNVRKKIRLRWWDTSARTYRTAAAADEETVLRLPDAPIPESSQRDYASEKPVFFGHYWETGTPQPHTKKLACVDYSACNGGPLVAYRWQGEQDLEVSHFISTEG